MTFADAFWAMIEFFFIVMLIWMFIAVFADIFRRNDIKGGTKAIWILCIFIIPLFGILIYLIMRPKMTEQDKQLIQEHQAAQRRASGYSTADELTKLAALKAAGTINDAEYEKLKAQAIA